MSDNRITVRMGAELINDLDIICKATGTDRAKAIRAILKKFFEDNEELIDKYYEEINNK